MRAVAILIYWCIHLIIVEHNTKYICEMMETYALVLITNICYFFPCHSEEWQSSRVRLFWQQRIANDVITQYTWEQQIFLCCGKDQIFLSGLQQCTAQCLATKEFQCFHSLFMVLYWYNFPTISSGSNGNGRSMGNVLVIKTSF